LKAALEEFSHEGVTGARTDEIARRAGVNKPCFIITQDKEGLYAQPWSRFFPACHERVASVLERPDLPPRERLPALCAKPTLTYIASAPLFPRLVQREFMRSAGRALSPAASRIMERHGKPLYSRLEKLIGGRH